MESDLNISYKYSAVWFYQELARREARAHALHRYG
jgi:beta-lactamase class D